MRWPLILASYHTRINLKTLAVAYSARIFCKVLLSSTNNMSTSSTSSTSTILLLFIIYVSICLSIILSVIYT